MGKLMRAIMLLCMSMCLTLGFTISAYAVDPAADKTATVEKFIQDTCSVQQDGSIRYTNGTVKAYTSATQDTAHDTLVTIGSGTNTKSLYYSSASSDILYTVASKYNANSNVNQKVNDITNNLGIEADTGAASIMLGGFKPIIALAVGIIVVLITFGMTLFSSLDICYIAFPVFRNKMEDMKQSGNAAMTKKSANGDVSLRWVTDDAQYAVTQGTIDSGKSPWMLYFKKRVASYIFLGIILFILMTGNISIITSLAINVVSGIINILSGLAS